MSVNDWPSLRGCQPLTVRPRSTSTNTRRPSIFLPSACLYAATQHRHHGIHTTHLHCAMDNTHLIPTLQSQQIYQYSSQTTVASLFNRCLWLFPCTLLIPHSWLFIGWIRWQDNNYSTTNFGIFNMTHNFFFLHWQCYTITCNVLCFNVSYNLLMQANGRNSINLR